MITKKQEQGEIPVRREPFREHKNQTGNLKNIERTPEHTGQAEEKHKKDVEEKKTKWKNSPDGVKSSGGWKNTRQRQIRTDGLESTLQWLLILKTVCA